MQFALLWAGLLCGMVPLVVLACSTGINGVTRACALAGIGLFGMVARAAAHPARAHWGTTSSATCGRPSRRTSGDVGHGSDLFANFPGLHQTINAFARLTGSPLWLAALAVIALAHVLSVLAVYQLVRAVGASPSGAAVGAVVYTLNPSWVYFDTSVSYESLALPLLLWCLAATVAASRAPRAAEPAIRRRGGAVCGGIADDPSPHHDHAVSDPGAAYRRRRRAQCPAASTAMDRGAPREQLWPLLLTAACLLIRSSSGGPDIRDDARLTTSARP